MSSNGNHQANSWLEQLGVLFVKLSELRRAMEHTAADRMAATEALAGLKYKQEALETDFLLHAQRERWLEGTNETARKLAKEKARADHGDEAPWKLRERAEEIETAEILLKQYDIKARLITEELEAAKLQVEICKSLAQADPAGELMPRISDGESGVRPLG